MAQRLSPSPRVPSWALPLPVFPARGWRRVPTPRPLARLPCPRSPPSRAPPSPRRAGRGLGKGRARAPPPPPSPSAPVLPGRRGRTVPSGASRDARRGGGPPWRLPGGVVRVRPATPGGASEPRLTRVARRPPPPAARPGRFSLGPSDVCSDPAVPRSVSLRSGPPPPRPRARVRLLAFPAPALSPRLARPACPCPASRCSPSPSVARGAWVRGCGEGRGCGVKRALGCPGRERGPVRPRRLWGGEGVGERAVSGVGVGGRWRRPAGRGLPPPSRAGSVGVSAPRGVGRGRDWRRGGVGLWPRVPPSCLARPPPPCPGT